MRAAFLRYWTWQSRPQTSGVHDFRKLLVWQMARELGVEIYRICAKPKAPAARLITTQLGRAALSIATNIAEGCGKGSRAETVRYLEIAAGSAAETEHHLLVAIELGILDAEHGRDLIAKVGSIRKMLRALVKRLPPQSDR
jgi:four helix bundle protein